MDPRCYMQGSAACMCSYSTLLLTPALVKRLGGSQLQHPVHSSPGRRHIYPEPSRHASLTSRWSLRHDGYYSLQCTRNMAGHTAGLTWSHNPSSPSRGHPPRPKQSGAWLAAAGGGSRSPHRATCHHTGTGGLTTTLACTDTLPTPIAPPGRLAHKGTASFVHPQERVRSWPLWQL